MSTKEDRTSEEQHQEKPLDPDSAATLRVNIEDARKAIVRLLELSHESVSGLLIPRPEDYARPLMVLSTALRGVEMVANDLEGKPTIAEQPLRGFEREHEGTL